MKKIIAIVLLLVLFATVLSACTGTTASASNAEPPPSSSQRPPDPAPVSSAPDSSIVHESSWPPEHECTVGTQGAPANFQEPAVCEICGMPFGEPLTPGFEELGFGIAEFDETLTYVSAIDNNFSVPDIGTASVSFKRIDSDEFYTPKEGYEWVVFHSYVVLGIDASEDQWPLMTHFLIDYYTLEESTFDGETTGTITISTGELCDTSRKVLFMDRTWRQVTGYMEAGLIREHVFEFEIAVCVPEGYDGIMYGLINAANGRNLETGEYLSDVEDYWTVADEDTLWYRGV